MAWLQCAFVKVVMNYTDSQSFGAICPMSFSYLDACPIFFPIDGQHFLISLDACP